MKKQNNYRTIKIKSVIADLIKKKAKEESRSILVVTERLINEGLKLEETK